MFDFRSYFCPRCGNPYHAEEADRRRSKVFCRTCPDRKLAISGLAYVIIGGILGVVYICYIIFFIIRTIIYEHDFVPGEKYINYAFPPAIFGFVLVGVVRIIEMKTLQSRNAGSKPAAPNTETEDENDVEEPPPSR